MVAIDMEMPRVCYECPVKQHCQIGISDGWRLDKRADDCPLVEIEERKEEKWIPVVNVDNSPFDNVQERKVGKWIEKLLEGKMICSCCNKDNKHNEYMDFCPNCGAEIRGVEDGSN